MAAAAHAQGALGSQWRSDLGLLNTGTGTAHVTILFHQGSGAASMVRNLSPGEQAVLAELETRQLTPVSLAQQQSYLLGGRNQPVLLCELDHDVLNGAQAGVPRQVVFTFGGNARVRR